MGGSYFADLVNQITFLVALAVSLNILLGFAGQMSMATAAFYGLGAYVQAVMTATGTTLMGTPVIGPGWPFLGGFISAIAVSFVAGLLVALPAARRVRGDYLILLTLAFHFLFITIVSTWVGVTGGPNGIVVPPISFFGHDIVSSDASLGILVGWALIVSLICLRVGASPFGRLLRGIRDDEVAIQAIGKDTVVPKSLAFGLTAAMAGATGALFAGYMQFVAPGSFSLDLAILVAACVALGGPGNVLGSVIAAIVIGSIRPILENMSFLASGTAVPWQTVIYGALLAIGMIVRPAGLLPETVLRARGGNSPKLETASAAPTLSTMTTQTDVRPVVEVMNVSKRFGGLQAASDVSLTLSPGEIVALIGPNGAGKSTVFNLMTGSFRPDTGDVKLRGQSVLDLSMAEIARRGMVRYFQHVRIMEGMTAAENVAIAVPEQTGESLLKTFILPGKTARDEKRVRAEALHWLDKVSAGAFADEAVRNLAFGQQKLIAFARLLATGADILLLDEPISGVDPAAAQQIIQLVRTLAAEGRAVCIVEHSLHVVQELADRVIFMDAGRVIAEGSVAEITSRRDLIDLYFGE